MKIIAKISFASKNLSLYEGQTADAPENTALPLIRAGYAEEIKSTDDGVGESEEPEKGAEESENTAKGAEKDENKRADSGKRKRVDKA